MKTRTLLSRAVMAGIVALGVLFARPATSLADGEERFDTPEDALHTLVAAAEARDTNAMHTIFGPSGRELISADVVQASDEFDAFVKRLEERAELVRESDTKATIRIGNDLWPFSVPIVQKDGKWFFDTDAGREEILNRRIGLNELGAMDVMRAYVEAQREYASEDRTGKDVMQYAQHLRSSTNSHDGLYWHTGPGEEQSPLGPLIAAARVEGYRRQTKILTADQPTPYHGYFFKILTEQGPHAPGGKYNYIINDHMVGGFAMVAWPAEWGNSGVMTFIVNQRGRIYQKNLGPKTSDIAPDMRAFDPDHTWKPAETEEDTNSAKQ